MEIQGVSLALDGSPIFEPDPVWTRIDDPSAIQAVTGWQIDRGRPDELQRSNPGSARVTLVDRDGRFDPTNPGSPYYGQVFPLLQAGIALQNPLDSSWSTLFRGFVSRWSYLVDVTETFATVTLELVDALGVFASTEMYPGEGVAFGDTVPYASTGDVYFAADPALNAVQTRINQVLDQLGWPLELRSIFTGNVGLQEATYSRRDAPLAPMLDAGDAEFPDVNQLYVSREGLVTFHGRYARFNPTNPEYGISSWAAGDEAAWQADPAVAVISDLEFSMPEDKIINACLCLPAGVAETDVPGQLVEDDQSIVANGWRGASFDGLLTRNGKDGATAVEETKKIASYFVANYAFPRPRVDKISFRPQAAGGAYGPSVWPLLCGVDIGDVVHLKTTHPGGGGFDEPFFVEGLHYRAAPMADTPEVTLDLDLSPAGYYTTDPF